MLILFFIFIFLNFISLSFQFKIRTSLIFSIRDEIRILVLLVETVPFIETYFNSTVIFSILARTINDIEKVSF